MKADSGPDHSGAVWTGECSGGFGFGLDLLLGCFLLSEPALVLCSLAEGIIVLHSTFTDKISPGRPVCCLVFPGFRVDAEVFKVCFYVILIPFLLPSWSPFPFDKLGVQDLLWEARVGHPDNMASPS